MSGAAVALHGGAGPVNRDRNTEAEEHALRAALEQARSALERGASALDAVELAVSLLEDSPLFNAGRGSVLTATGQVEMDAAIVEGEGRRTGAVAAVRRVRNPVRAARAVMDASPHVLLVGDDADRFAGDRGAALEPPDYFVTRLRLDQLERAKRKSRTALDHDDVRGTVGAVARDARGHLAAATSSGGMTNQLPGRVGDSPLLGAGTWADDASCAVSGTGHGEAFVRTAFAHEIDARVRLRSENLTRACQAALVGVARFGGSGGCVAVGRSGPPVVAFDTPAMFRGVSHAEVLRVGVFPEAASAETRLRALESRDVREISAAFAVIGWQASKPASQYERYLREQEAGERDVIVARLDDRFAGYVTIRWRSERAAFAEQGIPEIQDLNVLPDQRRRGIATRLLDEAEARIGERSPIAGIGFGLTADYGAAQRLYVLRGYVPDGCGITASHTPVEPGSEVKADDDLVLWMTKQLV